MNDILHAIFVLIKINSIISRSSESVNKRINIKNDKTKHVKEIRN